MKPDSAPDAGFKHECLASCQYMNTCKPLLKNERVMAIIQYLLSDKTFSYTLMPYQQQIHMWERLPIHPLTLI